MIPPPPAKIIISAPPPSAKTFLKFLNPAPPSQVRGRVHAMTYAMTTIYMKLYLHAECRKTSFIYCLVVSAKNLIWPVVFFYFSVHGDQQRNIYLQHWLYNSISDFKKLYFSKYSIKKCCKQITSFKNLSDHTNRFLMR